VRSAANLDPDFFCALLVTSRLVVELNRWRLYETCIVYPCAAKARKRAFILKIAGKALSP
jgi:hypothetical protein